MQTTKDVSCLRDSRTFVTIRIQQMAQSHTEPDEQSVQSLANHFTAMKAVEWLIEKYPGFFE